jgi:hypothetical protein
MSRYEIVTDATAGVLDVLAIRERDTGEIVERGIVAEGGRNPWSVARSLRDGLNRAGGRDLGGEA